MAGQVINSIISIFIARFLSHVLVMSTVYLGKALVCPGLQPLSVAHITLKSLAQKQLQTIGNNQTLHANIKTAPLIHFNYCSCVDMLLRSTATRTLAIHPSRKLSKYQKFGVRLKRFLSPWPSLGGTSLARGCLVEDECRFLFECNVYDTLQKESALVTIALFSILLSFQ